MANIVKVHFRKGDTAWCVRYYQNKLKASCGVISDIFFDPDMEIIYVVKNVGRGRFGTKIFKTEADALRYIKKRLGDKYECN